MNYDISYMKMALMLAEKGMGYTSPNPVVGAVLVKGDEIVGEGWNLPITLCDASAHAEIMALRDAGRSLDNYRLPGTTLYCTLEPCVMCAGAVVHARVRHLVFGAADPKGGACGSVFDLLPSDDRFNHRTSVEGGVLADECGELLRGFFRSRR